MLFTALMSFAVLCCPPPLLAADTDVNVKVCYPAPYPAPTIVSPTDGTTTQDSSVLVTGDATPDIPVYLYRDNVQVGFVTAGSDGVFGLSVSLVVGSNELKASTNNDCHAPSFSNIVTVERQTAPSPPEPEPEPEPEPSPETPSSPAAEEPSPAGGQPSAPGPSRPEQKKPPKETPEEGRRPVILEPRDGTLTHEPFVFVTGETTPGTRVQILRNDQPLAEVISDDQGKFTARIPLVPGRNRLVVKTGEGAATLTSEEITITYEPLDTSASQRWRQLLIWAAVGLGLGFIGYYLIWQPLLARRMQRVLMRKKGQE